MSHTAKNVYCNSLTVSHILYDASFLISFQGFFFLLDLLYLHLIVKLGVKKRPTIQTGLELAIYLVLAICLG